MGIKFYLGVHEPSWLAKTRHPLFVSFTRLRRNKGFPRAKSAWALDSGAFSELSSYGKWTISAPRYAEYVRQVVVEVGNLQWASIQDWICSPYATSKTGLSVKVHQLRTVENYTILRQIAPEVRWVPVIQGWTAQSYLAHLQLYRDHGFRLEDEPLVGVGSLASRKDSDEVPRILAALHDRGIRIHAFGLTDNTIARVHQQLSSADSMVWSFAARRRKLKHSTCHAGHKVCNNCLTFALEWRKHVLRGLNG